jgi:hypothetical protein
LETILNVERRTNPLKNVVNDGVRFIAASFGFVLCLSDLLLGGAPAALVTKAVVKVPIALISALPAATVEWAFGAMRVASKITARPATNASRT